MEIVLAIINAALLWAVWYFLGRCSIYAKLIKEYREALSHRRAGNYDTGLQNEV